MNEDQVMNRAADASAHPVQLVEDIDFPTEAHGHWRLLLYEDPANSDQHIALVKGNIDPAEPVLVRVHSECLTGDVFGSGRCDCGRQLEFAMGRIQAQGTGVLLYLRQEGRGIGLKHKIMAYKLQEHGYDTVEANLKLGFLPDVRNYAAGARILKDIGVRKVRLLTNNPQKCTGLRECGIEVVERVAIEVPACRTNTRYLRTKRDKMGHLIMRTEQEDSIHGAGA